MKRCVLKQNGKYLNEYNKWGSFSKAIVFFSNKQANEFAERFGGTIVNVKVIAVGDYDPVLTKAKQYMESTNHSKMGFGFTEIKGLGETVYSNKWNEQVVIKKVEFLQN